jgi:hypothetical protein
VRGYNTVVFIDDKESYVRVGAEHGWKCILFTPYVDPAEAIRAVHGDTTLPKSENVRVADSVEEVVDALKHFGLKL